MKIEKPDWIELTYNLGYGCPIKEQSAKYLTEWFDKKVEPINKMLASGIEMHATNINSDPSKLIWSADKALCTQKALLIDIQPIKIETAEHILRELVAGGYLGAYVQKRAKAVLEAPSDT